MDGDGKGGPDLPDLNRLSNNSDIMLPAFDHQYYQVAAFLIVSLLSHIANAIAKAQLVLGINARTQDDARHSEC